MSSLTLNNSNSSTIHTKNRNVTFTYNTTRRHNISYRCYSQETAQYISIIQSWFNCVEFKSVSNISEKRPTSHVDKRVISTNLSLRQTRHFDKNITSLRRTLNFLTSSFPRYLEFRIFDNHEILDLWRHGESAADFTADRVAKNFTRILPWLKMTPIFRSAPSP